MPESGARDQEPAAERGVLRVSPTCVIRLDELEWRTTGSGGPGGQHANTSDTRVEVRFPVAASTSLAPRQKQMLLDRLGPVARATASDSRSQARNRELALDRLRARLEAALRVDPPRRRTKPSNASTQARLDAKRRRSARKQDRRRPTGDE